MSCSVVKSLEHLHTDPMGLLAEINRVLKTGGTLFLSTPISPALMQSKKLCAEEVRRVWKVEFGGKAPTATIANTTACEVERISLAAGFHVGSLRTHDFYWPANRDVLRLLASQGHSIARREIPHFFWPANAPTFSNVFLKSSTPGKESKPIAANNSRVKHS